MPLVGFKVGMTMHLGSPQNNEYLKMYLEVKDIDTEADFNEQIQKVHATATQVMEWANETLGNEVLKKLEQ